MAISYYAEGVAACLLLLTVSVITQDDQEDYLLDVSIKTENCKLNYC